MYVPDVDECLEEARTCDAIGECVNNMGSYTCTCPTGYRQINGTSCRGEHWSKVTSSHHQTFLIQDLDVQVFQWHSVCSVAWMDEHTQTPLSGFLSLSSQMLMSVWMKQSFVPPTASVWTQRDPICVCVRMDSLPTLTHPPVMVRCNYNEKKHTHKVGVSFKRTYFWNIHTYWLTWLSFHIDLI